MSDEKKNSEETIDQQAQSGSAAEAANIFDFSSTDLEDTSKGTGPQFPTFNPKPEAGKEYIFRMRLIPYIKDPKNSISFKKYYWLTDGRSGFPFDSPSTLGKVFCPVSTAYWALHEDNSKDARKHALAQELRIIKQYGCTIQVKADTKNPENVGKIFTYRMPVDVYKFIWANTNLSEEAKKAGKKAKEFGNPLKAYDLLVTVTTTNDGRDYATELHDEQTSIMVDGNEAVTPDNKEALKKMQELMTTEWDIYEEFGYKEADEFTKKRVKHLLCTRYEQPNNFWNDIPLEDVTGATNSNSAAATTTLDQMPTSTASPQSSQGPADQGNAPTQTAAPTSAAEPGNAAPSGQAEQGNAQATKQQQPDEQKQENAAPAATNTADSAKSEDDDLDNIVKQIKGDNAQ